MNSPTAPSTRAGGRHLFLINRVDDLSGGTLRAVVNLSEALCGAGSEVTLSSPVSGDVPLRTVTAIDPRVTVRLFPASRPVYRFGGSARQFVWLARNLRSFDTVHIHSAFYLSAVYAAVLCRLFGVPYYVWSHGSLDPFDLQKHRIPKAALGWTLFGPVLRGATGLLCTSERERRDLRTFGARTPRHVVPLPVDAEQKPGEGATWRASLGLGAETFVVLFLGRIAPKKGLPRVIDALALIESSLDVVLVVAGAGFEESDTDTLRSHAIARGVQHRVRFLGWVEGADRAGALAGSDVFVLPSDNENFALAVVEALLNDLPVIVSDQVYISEDLGEAGGAVVVQREPAAVATAISDLARNPERARAYAAAGRRYVETNYRPAAVAEMLKQVHGLMKRDGTGTTRRRSGSGQR